MTDVNTAPMGGTELLLGFLRNALPELTNQVQIICSRPQDVELEDKPRILWLHDLPQDPSSQCLSDASYRTKFNKLVFVSHWQQQQYNLFLGIPFSEGVVIKNGAPVLDAQGKPYSAERKSRLIPCGTDEAQCDAACKATHEKKKLRFIYTPTPHRGLAILAAAASELAKERTDWELHVYSSLKLYGWHEQDKQFKYLYEKLEENPCVKYFGSRPNAEVRAALNDAHVFIYPSIWPETSCMSIMEAMQAGLLTITSNFAALPETCSEWAWMFQYNESPEIMAANTLANMRRAIDVYDEKDIQNVLTVQQQFYQNFYSFESRIPAWASLLNHVIKEGVKKEMVVFG